MSDLAKILAENQNEMPKLIAPTSKNSTNHQNIEDSDFGTEDVSPITALTPTKSETTTHKSTTIVVTPTL